MGGQFFGGADPKRGRSTVFPPSMGKVENVCQEAVRASRAGRVRDRTCVR